MSFTAKSVILDIADNWGDANYTALRSIEFWFEGALLTITATDVTAYGNNSGFPGYAIYAFRTDRSKIGTWDYTGWRSPSGTTGNVRIIGVFTNPITFDTVIINNAHSTGVVTTTGVKNVKINITLNTVTSLIYNSSIPNSTLIYDSLFLEHIASDVADDQTLTLIDPFTTSFAESINIADIQESYLNVVRVGFNENINISESLLNRTLPYQSLFIENVTIDDSISRLATLRLLSFSENTTIDDTLTPLATYLRSITENIDISDSADGFNFTAWFKTYARLAIPVYYFKLGSVEIPISSFTCRSTFEQPTFLSVVIPDYDTWGDIVAQNINEDLYIDMAFKVGGLVSVRENLIWTHFNNLSVSRGGSSKSMTLSGYRTISSEPQTITANISPVSGNISNDGKLRFTFAVPDLYAKAGDTYIVGNDMFIINSITYTVSADNVTMSISE